MTCQGGGGCYVSSYWRLGAFMTPTRSWWELGGWRTWHHEFFISEVNYLLTCVWTMNVLLSTMNLFTVGIWSSIHADKSSWICDLCYDFGDSWLLSHSSPQAAHHATKAVAAGQTGCGAGQQLVAARLSLQSKRRPSEQSNPPSPSLPNPKSSAPRQLPLGAEQLDTNRDVVSDFLPVCMASSFWWWT